MEKFVPASSHKLSEISLITNTDGIHSESILLGYIAEEPFVVLSAWINKYIISGYKKVLYPVGYCTFEYTIFIKDIGSRYSPANIIKHCYSDISSFESLNPQLELALLDSDGKKNEQFTLLSGILEDNEEIQKAIDYQDAVTATININSVLSILKNHDYGVDEQADYLMAYILKSAIEKIYD